jgi:hypothetical protein
MRTFPGFIPEGEKSAIAGGGRDGYRYGNLRNPASQERYGQFAPGCKTVAAGGMQVSS